MLDFMWKFVKIRLLDVTLRSTDPCRKGVALSRGGSHKTDPWRHPLSFYRGFFMPVGFPAGTGQTTVAAPRDCLSTASINGSATSTCTERTHSQQGTDNGHIGGYRVLPVRVSGSRTGRPMPYQGKRGYLSVKG